MTAHSYAFYISYYAYVAAYTWYLRVYGSSNVFRGGC